LKIRWKFVELRDKSVERGITINAIDKQLIMPSIVLMFGATPGVVFI